MKDVKDYERFGLELSQLEMTPFSKDQMKVLIEQNSPIYKFYCESRYNSDSWNFLSAIYQSEIGMSTKPEVTAEGLPKLKQIYTKFILGRDIPTTEEDLFEGIRPSEINLSDTIKAPLSAAIEADDLKAIAKLMVSARNAIQDLLSSNTPAFWSEYTQMEEQYAKTNPHMFFQPAPAANTNTSSCCCIIL